MSDTFKRTCSCCEGKGCEECDQTGERVTTFMDLEAGVTMRVSGSSELSPEDQRALMALGRAAYEQME